MTFEDRRNAEAAFVHIMAERLWNQSPVRERLIVMSNESDNYLASEVRQLFQDVRSVTVRHIRFAPDFLVVDRQFPDQAYLLDYKVTQTPIGHPARLSMLRTKLGREIPVEDIGQSEALAFDNYRVLAGIGVRVALLNYCAYHPRGLLCEFVDRVDPFHRDSVRGHNPIGSGTPFLNFDLQEFRTLGEFLLAEHGFPADRIQFLAQRTIAELSVRLPSRQHPSAARWNRRWFAD